jgi:hypothetical protein
VIEESNPQPEKHDELTISISDGMIMADELEKLQINL